MKKLALNKYAEEQKAQQAQQQQSVSAPPTDSHGTDATVQVRWSHA